MQQIVETLAAQACAADRDGVDREMLRALARPEFLEPFLHPGRLGEQLDMLEGLAGACGLTTFVFLQHVAAVRVLPRLRAGLAGIAMAHVLVETRMGRLYGTAPWFTGWGLMDALIVRAGTELWCVDTRTEGLAASAPLELCAMHASSTVALHFDGVKAEFVGPCEAALEPWIDVREAALPLGAAARVEHAGLRAQVESTRRRLREWSGCPAEAAALRVEALDVGLRATQAALVMAGGRGNRLDHPAQRQAREVLFYALMAGKKEALVERLTSPWRDGRRCDAPARTESAVGAGHRHGP